MAAYRSYRRWALAGLLVNGVLALAALIFVVGASLDIIEDMRGAAERMDLAFVIFVSLFLVAMILPFLCAGVCWQVYRADPLEHRAPTMRRNAIRLVIAVVGVYLAMSVTLAVVRDFDFEPQFLQVLATGWGLALLQVIVPVVLMRIDSPLGREMSVADRF